jgi:MFS family permease
MQDKARLSYFQIALMGFATLGASMFWSLNVAIIPPLLERTTRSATKIGFALSLGAMAGVFMPIITGLLSDRIETRWGKRRPFVIFGGALASIAIIFVPLSTNYLLTLSILAVLYIALNSYITPVFAFIADVVPAAQRGKAAGVYGVLRGMGTLIGFAVGGYLWRFGALPPFVATSLAVLVTALITIIGSAKYDRAFPTDGTDHKGDRMRDQSTDDWRSLKRYIKSLADYPEAMAFLFAQVFWWGAFGVAIPFFTLFAKNVLNVPISSSSSILTVFGIVAIVAMIPVSRLGDRWNPKAVMGIGLSILGVAGILGYFVRNITQVYAVMISCAVGVSALTTLPYAFIAEIGPKGREAEFYGLENVSVSAPQIIALWLGGTLIDYVGYRVIFLIAATAVLLSIIVLFFGEQGVRKLLGRSSIG